MFTDMTAHVDNMNGALSGFVIVYEPREKVVYHFTGTLRETRFRLPIPTVTPSRDILLPTAG